MAAEGQQGKWASVTDNVRMHSVGSSSASTQRNAVSGSVATPHSVRRSATPHSARAGGAAETFSAHSGVYVIAGLAMTATPEVLQAPCRHWRVLPWGGDAASREAAFTIERVDPGGSVLSRTKAVQAVDAAVADFAREFLASGRYRVPSLPEPGADYDAFCHAIRERRRRSNAIDALADLGFGPDLVGHACDAMALLADPDADVDKELVVRFLATTVRVSKRPPSAAVGTVAPTGAPFDLDAFARIAANAGDHGIDTRTRFQMTDLAHQSRRPGGRAKRV